LEKQQADRVATVAAINGIYEILELDSWDEWVDDCDENSQKLVPKLNIWNFEATLIYQVVDVPSVKVTSDRANI
jgi:hypothetical protein